MAEQHIIEIGPDGTTQVTVKGIKGKSCKDASKLLEAALGKTISSTPTKEMFEKEVAKKNA